MKALISFIRVTVTGGIIFLIPLVLAILIIGKAISILQKISGPLSKKLPDIYRGIDGSMLIAVLLLILICFLAGILYRSQGVKKKIAVLEEKFLSLIPGYFLMKSITADALGEQIEQGLVTVLVEEDGAWKIGYLAEEGKGYATVFFPEAPKHDSGEVLILPIDKIKRTNIPANVTSRSLKKYGRGIIEHLD